MISINAAAGFPQLQIVPGRTWLVEVPVMVQVSTFSLPLHIFPSRRDFLRRVFVQASVVDGLLGVAPATIADISLTAMQPSVTFEDPPNALHK